MNTIAFFDEKCIGSDPETLVPHWNQKIAVFFLPWMVHLITMVPLKTGGNRGRFARLHHGSKNPERNQFKNLFPVGRKGLCVASNQRPVGMAKCDDVEM